MLISVIVGIGVDVVDIARLEAALACTPRLRDRLFTGAEREPDRRHHRDDRDHPDTLRGAFRWEIEEG
jgi:phosphopantetheinyl transferase (holo-ACP synthase)